VRDQFLAGAAVVLDAVSSEAVVAAWESPSILPEQSVGSLVGHLARGSVWVVDEYLDRPSPASGRIDFESAAEYFATLMSMVTEDDHAAIRARGAEVADRGHAAIVEQLRATLDRLRARLPAEPPDRRIAVYGNSVMRLDDYLWTRIVEQVVHLDDLARSLVVEPWPNPPDAEALVIACGAEIGRRRLGGQAMIRALYRDGAATVLPVL